MSARICPKCRKSVRWDENLVSCYFSGGYGNGQACEECVATETGVPVPEPQRYPPGCNMPTIAGGGHMPICGLCRIALPDGVHKGTPIRIRAEMIAEGETTEPGGYSACAACVARWRPKIRDYLVREGILPEGTDERRVQGGLLF